MTEINKPTMPKLAVALKKLEKARLELAQTIRREMSAKVTDDKI